MKGQPLLRSILTQLLATGLEAPQEGLEPSSLDGLIRGVEVCLRLEGGIRQKRDDEVAAVADEVPAAGEGGLDGCRDRIQQDDTVAGLNLVAEGQPGDQQA